MRTKVDRTGQKFGKLTVKEESDTRLHSRVTWTCVCSCGKEKRATGNDLASGRVKTCGDSKCKTFNTKAANEAKTTHGKSNSRLYKIWASMKKRCGTHANYIHIPYCPEWESFISFSEWAESNGYSDTLTIDRIDNTKGYFPDNCRWVTMLTQGRNRTDNRIIKYKGIEKCLTEWAEYYNINTRTLKYRLDNGWDLEKAFTTKGGDYEGTR